MKDLKTQEGINDALKSIENSFLATLRSNMFDISPSAVCKVNSISIDLGIAESGESLRMAFASDIQLYSARSESMFGHKEAKINFCSSGIFTPSVKQSYWRTIHAATILKNWDIACDIINEHCKTYADLEDEILALKNQR